MDFIERSAPMYKCELCGKAIEVKTTYIFPMIKENEKQGDEKVDVCEECKRKIALGISNLKRV